MFDLDNLGQCRQVQHLQWCNSVANINLCKSYQAFYASSHCFRDIKVWNATMFDLENLGQSHRVQHEQWPHSMANINIFKRHNSSHHFQILEFQILGDWKGHHLQHSQWWHSMENTYLIEIIIFARSLTIYEVIAKQIKCQKLLLLEVKIKII